MKSFHSLALATLGAALLGLSGPAAAQAGGTVTASVAVTFAPKCQIATTSSASVSVDFGSVDAFSGGGTAATDSQTAVFECTRGYGATPTFTWDGGTAGTTVQGTIKGLRYQLAASSDKTSNGAAPTLGATPTNGTAATYDIKIDGTLYTGAGDDGAAASHSGGHTLVFSF